MQLETSGGPSLRSLTSQLWLAASPKSAPSRYDTTGHWGWVTKRKLKVRVDWDPKALLLKYPTFADSAKMCDCLSTWPVPPRAMERALEWRVQKLQLHQLRPLLDKSCPPTSAAAGSLQSPRLASCYVLNRTAHLLSVYNTPAHCLNFVTCEPGGGHQLAIGRLGRFSHSI